MTRPGIFHTVLLSILMSFSAGCSHIFETDADVQARKALQDLMKIQETYRKENNKYARNFLEIQKYDLKYHAGTVYLEIESAGADKYRAISLPAESTTARVFAYDTGKGGFYEMDEEEVKSYVLGALNHIRAKQRDQNIVDLVSGTLGLFLIATGIKFFIENEKRKFAWIYTAYFLGVFPLAWSLAILNHLSKKIVFTPLILSATAGGLALSVFCVFVAGWSYARSRSEFPPSILGLLVSGAVISMFSGWMLADALRRFYHP